MALVSHKICSVIVNNLQPFITSRTRPRYVFVRLSVQRSLPNSAIRHPSYRNIKTIESRDGRNSYCNPLNTDRKTQNKFTVVKMNVQNGGRKETGDRMKTRQFQEE
jgi:hypothetical protein